MNIFIPESAPFNADQRLWLNGYMAGLLAENIFRFRFTRLRQLRPKPSRS